MMNAWTMDVRHALRRLVRTPIFSLGALAIMAIAIGANTAAFAVVDAILLEPPPYDAPERVVNIYQDSDDGEPSSTSFPAYRDMASIQGVFAAVAASSPDQATLDTGRESLPLAIEYATSSLLQVIGRPVARGRWFDASMDEPGAGAWGVLSYHAWETRFGSDPDIVGRTLRVNAQPVTVIGIGPRGFNGLGGFLVTDLWLSVSSAHVGGPFRVANLDRREDHWYDVRARLAPGVTVARAQQAMNALAAELADAFPELNRGRAITVFPASSVRLHPQIDGMLFGGVAVVGAVVLLVLLLACSNLGSLLLVRGLHRTAEVAVRRALGASGGRTARLFLAESLVITGLGGVLGVLLARWLLTLVTAIPLPGVLAADMDLALDAGVLAFGVGLVLATGAFFGLVTSAQSLRAGVADTLREQSAGRTGGRKRFLVRNALVAAQVAVSLVLVVGAVVMTQSLVSYAEVDPGFDVDEVAFLQVNLSQAGIDAEARPPLIDELTTRLLSIPGVTDVATALRPPVQGGGTTTTVVEGYEPPSGTGSVELNYNLVSPVYFDALGIRVVDGRRFTEVDGAANAPVVIVNETAARRFWGNVNPVGRRIRGQGNPDSWREVIGVVSDVPVRSLSEPPTPQLYYAMGPAGVGLLNFVVRTDLDPGALLGAMRSEVRATHPRLPITRLTSGEGHLGKALAVPRTSAALLAVFSALALLLASVGIYTIVSYTVAGRLPEIGIRLTLGAARHRVIRLVVGEVAVTVVAGLFLGGAIVALVGGRLGDAVFGAEVMDPLTLLVAVTVLGGPVAVASYLPARRAAGADPLRALRA